MSTDLRDRLRDAAGPSDRLLDPDQAMRRGDRLRRRRQAVAGALVTVGVVAGGVLVVQVLPGVPEVEVAGPFDAHPEDPADPGGPADEATDDGGADLDAPRDVAKEAAEHGYPDIDAPAGPPDFRTFASGQLDDGRDWEARAAHGDRWFCLLFQVAGTNLVDNCGYGSGASSQWFFSSPQPGDPPVSAGFFGEDWQAPVEVEFTDGSTAVADVYEITGTGNHFYLVEHGRPESPTHLILHAVDGQPQRFHLETGERSSVHP